MKRTDRTRARAAIVLGAALLLALAFRLGGLAFGLPAVYNPDEVAIMNRAMALAQGGMNPHNFLYPSLYFYVLFAWEGLWFLVGRTAGVFDSLAAFERAFFINPTSIYLAGRVLSALAGTLTVWATYRLGTRLFGRVAGGIAALLLAVAPLAVRDAHYVKHDVPVTLLIVLAHVLIADEWLRPAPARRWWRPALVAGLAMSTHYYAIFLAVPLGLAAISPAAPGEPFRDRARRLAVLAAITAAAFAAASPFLLTEPATALRDIVANRHIVVDRATQARGLFGSMPFYLLWLVRDGAGPLTALAAVPGIAVVVRAGWSRAVVLLAFPVLFLLFIANTVPASRYLNPVLPFVAVLAGAGFSALYSRRAVITACAIACAMALGGVASAREDLFFRQTDTRSLARAWIERSVPAGASVLIQPYSVPLRQSRAGLEEALTAHLGSTTFASVRFQRELALSPYPAPAYRTIYLGTGGLDVDKIYIAPAAITAATGLEPLRRMGITYVVLKRFGDDDPSLDGLAEQLTRQAQLAARFSPYRAEAEAPAGTRPAPFVHNTDARITSALERPGPIVDIWRVE